MSLVCCAASETNRRATQGDEVRADDAEARHADKRKRPRFDVLPRASGPDGNPKRQRGRLHVKSSLTRRATKFIQNVGQRGATTGVPSASERPQR